MERAGGLSYGAVIPSQGSGKSISHLDFSWLVYERFTLPIPTPPHLLPWKINSSVNYCHIKMYVLCLNRRVSYGYESAFNLHLPGWHVLLCALMQFHFCKIKRDFYTDRSSTMGCGSRVRPFWAAKQQRARKRWTWEDTQGRSMVKLENSGRLRWRHAWEITEKRGCSRTRKVFRLWSQCTFEDLYLWRYVWKKYIPLKIYV